MYQVTKINIKFFVKYTFFQKTVVQCGKHKHDHLYATEEYAMQTSGMVFDIQRFALHDGPGIRTTVFLKGCSNRCQWCHNPESLSPQVQIQYYFSRCINCGQCVSVCPRGAHRLGNSGHVYDRAACHMCGLCASACNAQALVCSGKRMSAEEVLLEVNEDKAYYKSSGGGMTISGGEPALQKEFLAALLKGAKEREIHTAVETAGNYPFSNIEPSLPYIDLVLFDVKAFSPEIYQRYIHGDRETIYHTLMQLDAAGKRIIARTPVIGGVNDTPQEIEAVAAYVSNLQNLVHYQLIPYHSLGNAKRVALLEEATDFYTPTNESMAALERAAAKYVPVYNVKRGFIKEEQENQ